MGPDQLRWGPTNFSSSEMVIILFTFCCLKNNWLVLPTGLTPSFLCVRACVYMRRNMTTRRYCRNGPQLFHKVTVNQQYMTCPLPPSYRHSCFASQHSHVTKVIPRKLHFTTNPSLSAADIKKIYISQLVWEIVYLLTLEIQVKRRCKQVRLAYKQHCSV